MDCSCNIAIDALMDRVSEPNRLFHPDAKIKGVNGSVGNQMMVTEVRCSGYPLSLMSSDQHEPEARGTPIGIPS